MKETLTVEGCLAEDTDAILRGQLAAYNRASPYSQRSHTDRKKLRGSGTSLAGAQERMQPSRRRTYHFLDANGA